MKVIYWEINSDNKGGLLFEDLDDLNDFLSVRFGRDAIYYRAVRDASHLRGLFRVCSRFSADGYEDYCKNGSPPQCIGFFGVVEDDFTI